MYNVNYQLPTQLTETLGIDKYIQKPVLVASFTDVEITIILT
jgi:hypothetical protein